MAEYTWKTGIYGISGTSHPVSGPTEQPWGFFCHFTEQPEGYSGSRYQGYCQINRTDDINQLVTAWLQSLTVEITANDEDAPPPFFNVISIRADR